MGSVSLTFSVRMLDCAVAETDMAGTSSMPSSSMTRRCSSPLVRMEGKVSAMTCAVFSL